MTPSKYSSSKPQIRAALYARISTLNHGQDPEVQLGEIREFWKRIVDAVVVYRYDRFARSLRQLVNSLEEFRALGIEFISIHEGVDTSTPNGRLVFGIFASIAEFERELIRDRVRSGMAAAKAKA